MALSEREQQVLRDLEKQLHADDPSLAGSMRPAGGARRQKNHRATRGRNSRK